ncbi:hypothetical protein D3C72_1443330 [compost metagenome]
MSQARALGKDAAGRARQVHAGGNGAFQVLAQFSAAQVAKPVGVDAAKAHHSGRKLQIARGHFVRRAGVVHHIGVARAVDEHLGANCEPAFLCFDQQRVELAIRN